MLKPQMVRTLIPNLLSLVDYYVEQNGFKIPSHYNEKDLIKLINIYTENLLQCREESGPLEENLVSLSAIASPVINSMQEEDILVRLLGTK